MKKITVFLLAFVCLGMFSCSMGPVADGGDDFPNSKIAGVIVNEDGTVASNTQVTLVPEDHNPVGDGVVPDSLMVMTDDNGNYIIELADSGANYNIEATNTVLNTRALYYRVQITGSGSTVPVPPITLKEPGAAFFVLPDDADTADGYVFIPGTGLFERLSEENLISDIGALYIVFDDLPAGTLPGFYYAVESSSDAPVSISDSAVIASGDTTDLSTFTTEWTEYEVGNSGISSNTITTVLHDASGTIWVGTTDKGYAQFDGSVWAVYDTGNTTLPNNTVHTVVQHPNGEIIMGLPGAAVFMYDSSWSIWHYPVTSSMPEKGINAIAFDSHGNEYLASDTTIIQSINDTSFTGELVSDTKINRIHAIVVDHDNVVYLGTDAGLFSVITNSDPFLKTIPVGNLSKGENDIYDIAIDNNNEIWCATKKGVYHYNRSFWTLHDKTTLAIDDNEINSVAVDNNNIVWAGLKNSSTIVRLGTVPIVYSGETVGALKDAGAINEIEISVNNTIYFATSNGGLVELKIVPVNN